MSLANTKHRPRKLSKHWACLTIAIACCTTAAAGRQGAPNCPPDWVPVFGGIQTPNGEVLSTTKWNDGSGLALYMGGNFSEAGGQPMYGVLKWDGVAVTGLGTGPLPPLYTVYSLIGHDDGSGPALYASGSHGVQKWDGSTWTSMGTFAYSPSPTFVNIRALAVFDDGSGAKLYAGGVFSSINGQPILGLARWDGVAWSQVGAGFTITPFIVAMLAFDDGTGPALYVSGSFDSVGGVPAHNIAKWNGSTWSAVGVGTDFTVNALSVYDDGAGPALYAGGNCGSPPAPGCTFLSRWNGTAWTTFGGGVDNNVSALTTFDDGSGLALIATGTFTHAGGVPVGGLAKWDGASWALIGNGFPTQGRGLVTAEFGLGSELFVVGLGLTPVGESRLAKLGSVCGFSEPFCLGDGGGSACPCGNVSDASAASGCLNSLGAPGNLLGAGSAGISNDSHELYGSGLPNGGALYFQGTARVNGGNGIAFGDGLLCVTGSIVRLAVKFNANNWSQFPGPGDPTLSSAGLVTTPGTRAYQVWYRDAAAFCSGDTFNLTNGWSVVWVP